MGTKKSGRGSLNECGVAILVKPKGIFELLSRVLVEIRDTPHRGKTGCRVCFRSTISAQAFQVKDPRLFELHTLLPDEAFQN